ncbi:hypothetical protein [Sulfurovum sp.]|uniref:hypothetical protein n=1 Tax=Sulfurovum sp. TaxID=1969726 RepID=UPI002613F4F6|nr:hypothetical protein [Sulfurovum sp.]
MTLKYYRSATDNGGAIGDEITSGQMNGLFPTLTVTEEVLGADKFRKIWLESDEDGVDMYMGIADPGLFEAYLFYVVNSNDENIGDLDPAAQDYFGGVVVKSATIGEFTFDNVSKTLFRDGEFILHKNRLYDIDTVTDNGTDTTVSISGDFDPVPEAGDWITSMLNDTLDANTPSPYWRNNVTPSNYDPQTDRNPVQIVMVV